jgi:hypothetical protein
LASAAWVDETPVSARAKATMKTTDGNLNFKVLIAFPPSDHEMLLLIWATLRYYTIGPFDL